MAKTKGPLMSLDASGTVADTIVFSKWKGRNYVRSHVIPSNPQSPRQTAYRAQMAGLVALFKANVAMLNAAFGERAAQRSISPFNAFTGFNQNRLSLGRFAAISPTPTEAAPANNATNVAAVVTGRYVTVSWTDPLDADAWQILTYRKDGDDGSTGIIDELVAAVPRGTQRLEDGPLAAGQYTYRLFSVSIQGGRNQALAFVTVIVG